MALDFPNSPTVGQIFTGGMGSWQWDGTKWVPNSAGTGTVTISDTPPASPTVGSFWFDSVGVQLYVYYNDGNSSQWVPANNQALAGFLALTGGTMTGAITLSGNAASALQATPLQQVQQIASADSAPNVGRNLADNALFQVQQRGAGPWTANGYTADRYFLSFITDTDSMSVIALTDAQRAQIGDEAAVWGLQNSFTGNAAAGAYSLLLQPIEKVRRLAGKTITVSFFAVASAPLSLGVSYNQNFGTGGSPSATVFGAGTAVAISSTFARYQVTFNLPSSAGKTLGTNGDDCTVINLWYSSGSTHAPNSGIGVQAGVITLWGVQVEIGTQATALEKLQPQPDLARCQRFYQTGTTGGVGYQLTGALYQVAAFYPTSMRASPTITLSAITNTNLGTLSTSTGGGTTGFLVWGTVVASGSCTISANFAVSADL